MTLTILTTLSRATALATMIAAGTSAAATAQTTAADPHHPGTMLAQVMPSAGMMDQGLGAQPGQSSMPLGQPAMMCGMMQPGMMGQSMTGHRMMGRGMMGMPGATPMKIMFAIADANGDSALSFDEVTAIHRRIYDTIDANRDGRATREEIQAFMRE
ncbi:MAG: EF-hand protein [Microvirga sp.]|nr:EF-hand protein [Microvirga sp.]